MATIRKRGDRWQAIVRRRGIKESRTFDRQGDAAAWARALERDADLGGVLPKRSTDSIAALIDRYEVELWPRKRWGKSKQHELGKLREDIGNWSLAAPVRQKLIDYLRGLTITPGHVGSRASYLVEVLRTARDLWGLTVPLEEVESAVGALRRGGFIAKSKPRTRQPTADEVARVIAFGDNRPPNAFIDLGDIVRVLSTVPLRLSELLEIEWADLDEGKRAARIVGRKSVDTAEKESGVWLVPMIRFGGIDAFDVIWKRPRYLPRPFPYIASSVSFAFTQATRQLGIADFHLHDLRAYSISRLLQSGMTLPNVCAMSGHTNWLTLQRHYARLMPSPVHMEAGRIDPA